MQNIGLGIIGLGGFGMFALQQFVQIDGVKLQMIGGTTREEAHRAAARYGATVGTIEEVLDNKDVELVYINTPPFLHAAQAMQALRAGKHVIVEKPLATLLDDGEQLIKFARERGLMLTTNLMQRYNPLVIRLEELIRLELLGKPLYFNLANHAVDEGLSPDHWFWDAEKSGGIFVEHAVHFFDLANAWFGEGKVLSSGSSVRTDGCEDQVWCDVNYMNGTLGRFYHGFNQASRTEQQTWELVFERGRIAMSGWIPMSIDSTAVADEATTKRLTDQFPGASIDALESYAGNRRGARGHGIIHDAYQKFHLQWHVGEEKQVLYCQLLRSMLRDQVAWLRDRSHVRIVTEQDGLSSLRYAIDARDGRMKR